jgi:hypothetical protein
VPYPLAVIPDIPHLARNTHGRQSRPVLVYSSACQTPSHPPALPMTASVCNTQSLEGQHYRIAWYQQHTLMVRSEAPLKRHPLNEPRCIAMMILFHAAIDAQLMYAAPSHLHSLCIQHQVTTDYRQLTSIVRSEAPLKRHPFRDPRCIAMCILSFAALDAQLVYPAPSHYRL